MPIEDIAVIAVVLFVGGAMKGATGVGLPIVAVPVVAAYFNLHLAVATIILPSLVANGWQIWRYRDERPPAYLLWAVPIGTTVGVAIGVWLLASLPARYLELAVAAVVVIFLISRFVNPEWGIGATAGRALSLPAMVLTGVTQGATGISGPVVVMYWSSLRVGRDAFVFGVSLVFFVTGMLHLGAMVIAGLFGTFELIVSLVVLVPATLGIPAGEWLARRMSMVWFDRIIMATLAAMAVKLVASGVTG